MMTCIPLKLPWIYLGEMPRVNSQKFSHLRLLVCMASNLGKSCLTRKIISLGFALREEFHTVLWPNSLEKKGKINSFAGQCTPVLGVDLLILFLPNELSCNCNKDHWFCPYY